MKLQSGKIRVDWKEWSFAETGRFMQASEIERAREPGVTLATSPHLVAERRKPSDELFFDFGVFDKIDSSIDARTNRLSGMAPF